MTARIESLRRRPRRRLLMVGLLLASLLGVATATPAFAATVIAATPATGLVDGQTIHLSIGGFGTGTSVGIAQCVNDFDYNRHCSGVQGGTVDAFGGLEIDVQVWALITTSEFGVVDCRNPGPHTCVIGANVAPTTDGAATTPIAFDPGGALIPAPPIVVTPSSDLVNDQAVFVTGSGFGVFDYPNIRQCVAGRPADTGCSVSSPPDIIQGPVNPDGTWVAALRVRSVIATATDTFDCRVAANACEMRALVSRGSGQRESVAGISFVAGTGTPSLPAITVTPNTGLGDFTDVHIEGTGFPIYPGYFGQAVPVADAPAKTLQPYSTVLVSECSTSAPVTCVALGYANTYDDGTIDADVDVRATIWSSSTGTAFDCRPAAGRCQLVVGGSGYGDPAFAPLTFTPGTPLLPPPTLTATPNSGLVDHQVIDLSGTGFEYVTTSYPLYPGYGIDASLPLRTDPVSGQQVPDVAAWEQSIAEAKRTAGTPGHPPAQVEQPTGSAAAGADGTAALGPVFIYVAQCVSGLSTQEGCDYNTQTAVTVDDDGTLHGRFQAHAVINRNSISTSPVPVDCRVVPCEIRTVQTDDPQLTGIAPIAFQPGSPLAPAPTITVTPSTGLRDGQRVQVHGENFSWRGENQNAVILSQCLHDFDPNTSSPCDSSSNTYLTAYPAEDGSFDLAMNLSADIVTYVYSQFDSGQVVNDCRTVACDVVAMESQSYYNPQDRHTAPLQFDPNAPLQGLPSATTNQGAALPDPAPVDVSFSGFTAGQMVRVLQCRDSGPLTMLSCADANTATTTTGNLGEGHVAFTAQRFLTLNDGTVVDCATTWCPIMVVGVDRPDQVAAAFVWFAQGAPPGPPPTNPPPTPPLVNPRFTG